MAQFKFLTFFILFYSFTPTSPSISGGSTAHTKHGFCNYSSCSQICTNIASFYVCSCQEGFQYAINDTTGCDPIDPHQGIIYSSTHRISLLQPGSTSSSEEHHIYDSTDPNTIINGVSIDFRTNFIYFTKSNQQTNENSIERRHTSNLALTETFIDSGLVEPEGIAIDWITGNIYFIDSGLSSIVVCGNSTNLCATIAKNQTELKEIALHPNLGVMIWSLWNDGNGSIIKANMDGSEAKEIFTEKSHQPKSLVIDQGNDRIYWIDLHSDKIETIKLDGSERRTVIAEAKTSYGGLAIFGDNLYWSQASSEVGNNEHLNFIKSVDKRSGREVKNHYEVNHGFMVTQALAIYHIANQPIIREDPCKSANCSVCVLMGEKSFRCLCPDGFELDKDNKSCIEKNGNNKLVIASKNIIKLINYEAIGRELVEDIRLPIGDIFDIIFYPQNNSLVLTDSRIIYGYDLELKKLNVLIKDLGNVKAMDVDIIGENLYWVDSEKESIEVMSLRNFKSKTIFNGIKEVADILIVAGHGKLYASVGFGPKMSVILEMDLDGDNTDIFAHLYRMPPTLSYDLDDNLVKYNNKYQLKHAINQFSLNVTDEKIFYSKKGGMKRSIRIGNFREIGNNSESKFMPRMALIRRNFSYLNYLIEEHECSWKNPKRMKCSDLCLLKVKGFKGVCECGKGRTLNEDGLGCRREEIFEEIYNGKSEMGIIIVESLILVVLIVIIILVVVKLWRLDLFWKRGRGTSRVKFVNEMEEEPPVVLSTL